ncbi:TPA: hypothetical protein ACKQES_004963 [Serratia marcescens]
MYVKLTFTCLLMMSFSAFSSTHADQSKTRVPEASNLFIVSSPVLESDTTTLENGVKHYAKEFNVKVYNMTSSELTFATDKGCFIAENDKGDVRITQKLVEPSLLEHLRSKDANQGTVLFSSTDDSVLKTKFVTWSSTDCHYMNKRNKAAY